MKWSRTAPGRVFEDDSDSVVYYSLGSGGTHLISSLSAFVLETLAASPRSTEDLLLQIARYTQDEVSSDELRNALKTVLRDLRGFDLIDSDETS